MSGFGLLLIVLSSAVICMTVIGTSLLVVGLWKYFIKKNKKETVKEMNTNQPVMKREDALEVLKTKNWWNATSPLVRTTILAMPPLWDGFITDLARRAEMVGGVTQIRIVQFLPDPAMYGCLITFEVIQPNGNPGTYMYHSWGRGGFSGSKGLVFVRNGSKITHFIRLRVERFSVGGNEGDDCPGGFGLPGEDALKTMVKELQEELMVKINILETVPLGPVHVDGGVTCNNPELFYVVVDGNGIPPEAASEMLDGAESRMKYRLVPIEQFMDFLNTCDDGLCLNIVAKMLGKGHVLWA